MDFTVNLDFKMNDITNDYDLITEIINELFLEFQSIFPAFKQAWPSQEIFDSAKKTWIKAFIEAGMQDLSVLQYGLKALRASKSPFVPTPGQFIEMCKPSPESFGLPSVMDAYKEACRNSHPFADKKWTHIAVFEAAFQTGSHELKTMTMKESYPIFAHNYEIMMRRVMNGEKLEKKIDKAIPEKINSPSTKEVARNALESLKQSLR